MKIIQFIFSVCLLITACSEGPEKAEQANDELIVNCDCNELVFDQAYNNFYLDKPRNGYSGTCEIFYANGNRSTFKNFEKGKLNGEVILYHENGEVAERKFFDKNLQTGDHFIYAENGELISQRRFERGRFIESIFPKH